MAALRFLLLVAIWFSSLAKLIAEKPFDFASTPGKLPKHVIPQEYAIRITPDLKKLTFLGSETVKLDVREAVRELVLNALVLQITSAALDDKPLPNSALKVDPKEETLKISLPEEI